MRNSRAFKPKKSQLSDSAKLYVFTDLPFLIDHENEKEFWDMYKDEIMEFWQSDLQDSEWYESDDYRCYAYFKTPEERKKRKPILFLKYGMG